MLDLKKKNRQTFLLKLSEFKPDLWLTALIYKVGKNKSPS